MRKLYAILVAISLSLFSCYAAAGPPAQDGGYYIASTQPTEVPIDEETEQDREAALMETRLAKVPATIVLESFATVTVYEINNQTNKSSDTFKKPEVGW